MDDLAKRLRFFAADESQRLSPAGKRIVGQAADEIERLQTLCGHIVELLRTVNPYSR